MDYVFSTPLIQYLTEKFFNVPVFRNTTLQCLAEIGKYLPAHCPDSNLLSNENSCANTLSPQIAMSSAVVVA